MGKDRLDSWKEIAAYLDRDVRTAQRWERDWSLPVHRLPGGPKAGVFAFRSELDVWMESNRAEVVAANGREEIVAEPPARGRRIRLRWIILGTSLAVLGVAGWFALVVARDPKILFANESRYTPFATTLAMQACPAWSPDGKSIAFVGRDGGRLRLFVQGVENSTQAALTGPEATLVGDAERWCRRPFWSPDSQWIYFLGSVERASGVYRVAVAGGPPALVQRGAIAATISPDGRTLVFLARPGEGAPFKICIASPPDGARRAYEPAPFEANGFANIPEVAFSPDGAQIFAGVTINSANQYWRLPWPAGKPARVFAKAERAVGAPRVAWMPDSRHMVLSAGGPLAAADIRTGRYWPIAMQDREMYAPSPSPDGSRVAYQSMLSHADVIAMPLGEGPIETLLGSSSWEQMPAASPAASQVVYVTNRKPRGVWLKNLDGGLDRPLVAEKELRVAGQPTQLILTPVFSPDGARVAFTAASPANGAVFTVAVSGGTPVRVSPETEKDISSASWSPDGKWLVVGRRTTGDWKLAKMRPGSADAPIELARMCGMSMPEWSPTGEWIAFTDETCRSALISPDGKEKRVLGGSGTVAWARDGKALYRLDLATHSLVAVDVAAGKERVLRDVGELMPYSGPRPGLRASVTADGTRIVYSVLRPREEIWILEDVQIREPWYARLLTLLK